MQLFNLLLLDQLEDVVLSFLKHQVYLAPVLLLFIEEAGVPLPFADYVIMYMGLRVSQGFLSFPIAFVLLLIADLAGASILYLLCVQFGPYIIHRLGRYIHLDKRKLDRVEQKFRKFGSWFIIFGRHIPGMRIPITVFAGVSGISYRQFIVSTFISVVLWIPLYLYLGENLGPQAVHLMHANGWYTLFLVLPVIFLVAPIFLLRKGRSEPEEQLSQEVEDEFGD